MASRLPVVATQEGGLAEFISDETAWVVEKDSPQQIAGAVKSILANPNQVEQRTDFARRMVEEKYNWDAVAKAMNERVFGRVL
jgi:glycosyltransferase involved in cell wall biosynthesis